MKDHMLTYRRSYHLKVIWCLDLDFVGCLNFRNFTFGYLVLVGEIISWKSVKQLVIVASIMKVEFMVCFEATNHGLWLQNFIPGLEVIYNIVKPFKIYYERQVFKLKVLNIWNWNTFAVIKEIQEQRMLIEHISTWLWIY